MEYVTLYNDVKMPQLGYGVYQVTQEEWGTKAQELYPGLTLYSCGIIMYR